MGATAAQAAPVVYVTNQVSDNVSQFDVGPGGALSPKSPATVPAGDVPFGVAVSPDGGSVYVTNSGSDAVSQFDVGRAGRCAQEPGDGARGRLPFRGGGQPGRRLGLRH